MIMVERLYRLQKIDSKLRDIEDQRDDQSQLKELVNLKKQEKKLEKVKEQSKQDLLTLQQEIKEGEREITDLSYEIAKYKEKLYNGEITNSKELEHLEIKINELLSQVDEQEQSIIERMEVAESLERKINDLDESCQELSERCRQFEKTLKTHLGKLRRREKRLTTDREEILIELPKNAYQQYQKLARTHNGVAVARVKKNTCTGCQVGLSEFMLEKVRHSDELVFCEFCGRVLFFPRRNKSGGNGETK